MIAAIESDAFAIAMLLVICSGLGVVALLILTMRWRVARLAKLVDALFEGMEGEQGQLAVSTSSNVQREAWERDPDWWRADSQADG